MSGSRKYITARQCVVCGTTFGVTAKHPNTKTCGRKCGGKARDLAPAPEPIFNPKTDTYLIPLKGRGGPYYAEIDAEFIALAAHKWYARVPKSRYVVYAQRRQRGANVTIPLHREVLALSLGRSLDKDELVDHVDRNGLNCRLSNLRLATPTQNAMNRKRRNDNRSGYKGVYWHASNNKWRAEITVNGKTVTIGQYDDPKCAHQAYVRAAIEYFGEFANDGGE